jgi:hypothetical protein
MKKLSQLIVLLLTFSVSILSAQNGSLRLPAVPLVSSNPYFSIWSFSHHPGTDWPRHWTGTVQAMACFAKIDGVNYRLLGATHREVPAMELTNTVVTPTRTIYSFEQDGVSIRLTFTNPMLADDLVLLSQALTYVTWEMESLDGKPHQLKIYFDVSAELVVNTFDQEVTWSWPMMIFSELSS